MPNASGNAVIYIGGKLKRSLLAEFTNAVRNTGGGPDWGESYLEEDLKDEQGVLYAVTSEGSGDHFIVRHNNAPNMVFDDLEGWLKKHGLPFDRHSDAVYEFDAIWEFYRPGVTEDRIEKTFTVMSDQQDGQYVDAVGVLTARKALAHGDAHGALAALDNVLKGYERILPLEKFEIIDG